MSMGWPGPKMAVINSGATRKTSLRRFASFLPEDGERNIFLFLFAPDTDCGQSVSLQCMIHIMGVGR